VIIFLGDATKKHSLLFQHVTLLKSADSIMKANIITTGNTLYIWEWNKITNTQCPKWLRTNDSKKSILLHLDHEESFIVAYSVIKTHHQPYENILLQQQAQPKIRHAHVQYCAKTQQKF
jgi:hypothetical protein